MPVSSDRIEVSLPGPVFKPLPSRGHGKRGPVRMASSCRCPTRGSGSPLPGHASGEMAVEESRGPTPLPFVDPERDLDAVREVARPRGACCSAEIEKRIIGQEQVVDQLLVALFARGHCLFVGVPGLAKTLLISDARRGAGPVVRAHPVHARPDAGGHHRHRRARGGPRHRPPRVPLHARAGLRATSCSPTRSTARRRRRRRRCCSRCRSTAVTAGGQTLRAAAAVPGVRDAEPDRAGGHLPAARGAARSLHVPDRRRLPDGGRGGAHRQPA